ncbi:MAG: DUF1566 domain-containing protein [Gallionella sp.]|nr:DUF1566 domain-containing protein [Gallionella sp.]
MKTKLALLFLILGSSPLMAEQSCDTQAYPMSLHAEQFIDNGDGTLTDNQSKLTWMRCSLGQTWTGTTCIGTPTTHTLLVAVAEACKLNEQGGYAGHSDWRVPQIPELAMIVERQCTNPRTNQALFPETPSNYFWTATPPADPGNGYVLSFGAEGAMYKSRGEMLHVRLVSGGKPM